MAAWGQFIHPQAHAPGADGVTALAARLRGARWSPERAAKYMSGVGVIKGSNYVPADAASLWVEPDEYVIDRELGWAQAIGLNSIRVTVPGTLFEAGREAFFTRFEWLLATAAKHKLSVLPTFSVEAMANPPRASGSPAQRAFQPGIHGTPRRRPGQPPPPEPAYRERWSTVKPAAGRFVRAVLERYRSDARIAAWDLWNEPKREDRPMVEDLFAFAREADPAQPLTAVWQGEDLSDVYSFHTYARPGDPNGPEPGLLPFEKELGDALASGRPLLCTECLARTFGNTFQTFLPPFAENRVGWYIWGLCAGTAQHHYPWRWPVGSPEPKTWFHCVLYPDGTPYREEEVALIKSFGFTKWW